MIDEPSAREAYLIVSDRQARSDEKTIPEGEIFEQNPKILRNCGINNFSVWASNGMPEGPGVTSGFVISEQSDDAISCVLKSIADREVYGWVSSADNPHALSPVVDDFQKMGAAEEHAQTH
jgi:hypothetical protein